MESSSSSSRSASTPLESEVQRILDFISDTRYLAAKNAYDSLAASLLPEDSSSDKKMSSSISSSNSSNYCNRVEGVDVTSESRKKAKIRQQLVDRQEDIDQMLSRAAHIIETLEFSGDGDESWILGMEMLGVTTHYKTHPEDGSLTIKLEGLMEESPLFELCAVLYEVDLYKEWIPFCQDSLAVDRIGRAELYPYICVNVPPWTRDMLLHVYAADILQEANKIVILGNSVEDYTAKTVPFRSSGWFHQQMVCKEFSVVIEVLSPTKIKTCIMAQVDPKVALPQVLINFVMKNMAGVFLYLLEKQAMKVHRNPDSEGDKDHAHRMRSNPDFYINWVLPKWR